MASAAPSLIKQHDLLLTVSQAAAILTIHEKTVYLWIAGGRITPVRLGRHLRIRESELDRFVARCSAAEL